MRVLLKNLLILCILTAKKQQFFLQQMAVETKTVARSTDLQRG